MPEWCRRCAPKKSSHRLDATRKRMPLIQMQWAKVPGTARKSGGYFMLLAKRQGTGAVQDALRISGIIGPRAASWSAAALRRFYVAAGILPAVEPGRPARRRKRSPTPTMLENFRTALSFHRSFRAAGRQPSTADETSAATTPSPLFSRATANCANVNWNCHIIRVHLITPDAAPDVWAGRFWFCAAGLPFLPREENLSGNLVCRGVRRAGNRARAFRPPALPPA